MLNGVPPPPLHKRRESQENDGHTGSRCLDKAVLPQGGGRSGGHKGRATLARPVAQGPSMRRFFGQRITLESQTDMVRVWTVFVVQTKMSWRTLLIIRYSRQPLGIKAAMIPQNDCGSGSDT